MMMVLPASRRRQLRRVDHPERRASSAPLPSKKDRRQHRSTAADAPDQQDRRDKRLLVHDVMCDDLGVPAALRDRCCRIFLQRQGQCKFGTRCHRIHWRATDLTRWLVREGLCDFDTAHLVCREELSRVSDVAFRFPTAAEASKAGCELAWSACQHNARAEAHDVGTTIATEAAQRRAVEAPPAKARPHPMLKLKKGLRIARQPTTQGAADEAGDLENRQAAARELATLASQWLEANCENWLEEKARLVERFVTRKFEAASTRAAATLWTNKLVPWCMTRKPPLDARQLTPGQLEDFVNEEARTCSTGPRT